RVYVHIREETQRPQAIDDAKRIQTKLGADYILPGIQRVEKGPSATELRYFRPSEEKEAHAIAQALKDSGIDAKVQYITGYEQSTGIRPRHFELWYGPPVRGGG